MTVFERLRALAQPIQDELGDEYRIANDITAGIFAVRPIRLRAVMLVRIREASAPLSIRHIYRRAYAAMRAAIRTITPELSWFKNYPDVKPSGREMTIPLRLT